MKNHNLALSLFIGVGFCSTAYADPSCTVNPSINEIEIKNIYVPAGAENGIILGESGPVKKTVYCPSDLPLRATTADTSSKTKNHDVSLNFHSLKCTAMESDYPGIGFIWYNHNSATNAWHCISSQSKARRGLSIRSEGATITDEVYLVKTGPIQSGIMNFNESFEWDEVLNSDDNSNFGLLFSTRMYGNTVIEAPFCDTSLINDQSQFLTKDALAKSFDRIINYKVSCIGAIESGSTIDLFLNPIYKSYSEDSSYHGTSLASVGSRIEYSTAENPTAFNVIPTSSNRLTGIKMLSNTTNIQIKVTPYIKDNTGNYPLENNVKVDFDIKSERN